MFEAKIIEDSISPNSIRLTTLQVRYPRFIHPELITHRVFSRNARSSRAVPTDRLVEEDIFTPQFMKNQPGMQSRQELSRQDREEAEALWQDMAMQCLAGVRQLSKLGVHKQWANRPLEWFGYIDVLISSTYWENFWELRRHEDAQPEIRILADLMYSAMDSAVPTPRSFGQWHLPYISQEEREQVDIDTLLILSTARCARLSYKPFDGNSSIEDELRRYQKLIVSRPVHASPAEHQATPDRQPEMQSMRASPQRRDWEAPALWGNYFGWKQHRKLIGTESVMEIQQWG